VAYSFNGSDECLYVDAAPATDTPLTMACWFNIDVGYDNHGLIYLGDKDRNKNYWALIAAGYESGDPVAARARGEGNPYTALTSTGYTKDTWHHGAAVFTSDTSRTAYIDGGSSGSETTDVAPTDADRVSIGAVMYSPSENWCNGFIAEAAIWDVALTAAEIASLAAGASPLLVRPQSLVGYWPLIRGLEDRVGGNTLSLNNTPSVLDHIPIYYPAPVMGFTQPASASEDVEVSLSVSRIATIAQSGVGESVGDMALSSVLTASQSALGESVGDAALSSVFAASQSALGQVAGGVQVEKVVSISEEALAQLAASASLSLTQGISEDGLAVALSDSELSSLKSISQGAGVQATSSLAVAIYESMAASAGASTEASVLGERSAGLSSSGLASALVSIVESTVLAISASSGLNYDVSLSIGHSRGLTESGASGALSSVSISVSRADSIAGRAGAGADLGLNASVVAEILATVASIAGIDLQVVSAIQTSGTIVDLDIVTPAERTLFVLRENRSISVGHEGRAYFISFEDRKMEEK